MTKFHLHLLSDSTGETLEAVAKAAIAQFKGADPIRHFWPMIRHTRQLERVVDNIASHPGLVMFTLVDETIRASLVESCRRLNVPFIAVLDPVIEELGRYLGEKSLAKPGEQHALTAEYFARIDAMNFTLAHDDGQLGDNLAKADVILVGVSRTSKTPTSIYLANRGVKTANIPIVRGCPLPEELFTVTKPLIVGLVTNPERLIEVRRNRLKSMQETRETSYIDPDAVREEIAYARRLCAERNWPMIDVTRRSIEETAAAVLNLLAQRENGGTPK
ncbi:MAG: phosphoenolpyruvate synthase regulatory protein [Proteobacteria bacterium]|jgi:regulator of PEP synthase PpsR (kinase-PPPase family)|nr:MAG: phosphoenolpyruvate synthase regulatory protein [Pseudomonadota bacterium]